MAEGTLSDAIRETSTEMIIDEFGIPSLHKGGKIQILCPGHDDHSFGSCFVDRNDNGYFCYACGNKHVNKWDMLLQVSGFSGRSAAEWFFQKAGITPTNKANPLARILKFIKEVSVYIDNSSVYDDQYVCTDADSSYGRVLRGEYLYSEVITNNPLLDLYKASPNLFVNTVVNALQVKKEELEKTEKFCAKHMNDIVMGKGSVNKNPLFAEAREECIARIKTLDNLIIDAQEWKI